ncbi:uncharacterized protein GO595_007530 [Histomonas meleagridis]|uniref:uncharacterized protein n=1 Tax=Histomonas meleagridis TaxID=135588 RepID=UPI00355953E5|nr:hypothetical protein GO595_007530 [Histomonas meleagridis]
MYAPQNQQPNVIDAMSGNLEDWYNAVDDCLKLSEIIPGNYEYTTATSYGNVGDINEGDTTYVDIATDRFKIISLDNSYITLKQTVKITVPDQTNLLFKEYYIGYKCSCDAIDQYRIYSNTDKIQDIHNARYEWFMFYNSLSDEAKSGNDCFATIDKIRNHDPMVPGVYVDLSAINAAKEITVEIPLRIPLSYFLLLFNMRYYPNWAGKLSIELMPSYQNLVIAPIPNYDNILLKNDDSDNDKRKYYIDIRDIINNGDVDLGFRNINETVYNNIKETDSSGSYTYTEQQQQFICNTQTTKDIKIKLAKYLLKMDVFNALSAKYIQVPLLFPIHICQVRDFTQEFIGDKSSIDTAATIGIRHCDTLFTVFRVNQYSRTCFLNPHISYRFNIDGKMYPREDYTTVDDAKNINMLLDSVNLNGSLLSSLNEDLKTSIQPYYYKNTYNASGVKTTTRIWHGKDNSNFFIGLPFAEGEDFQGGISTTGTIQIELHGNRVNTTDYLATSPNASPVGIYFEDAILKIRSVKPEGRSQIEITNASVNQVINGLR